MQGKFGRFALKRAEEDVEDEEPLDDILVMGTTIGLSGLDRGGYMESLRHRQLTNKVREIFKERDLLGQEVRVDEVDYGATSIWVEGDVATAVSISGSSYDYGRANAEGRQETCDAFTKALGKEIKVRNSDPDPDRYDRIVG